MQVFKHIESAKYYEQYQGKVLDEKNVPKKIFADLMDYDKTFFRMKGIHIFSSIVLAK